MKTAFAWTLVGGRTDTTLCYSIVNMATELFEDIFEVRQLNPDGKKFDKGMLLSTLLLFILLLLLLQVLQVPRYGR